MTEPMTLFRWLRRTVFRNSFRLLYTESFVRALTIFLCCVIIWGTLFSLSYAGYHELKTRWNLRLDLGIQEFIFDFLFFVLMILLFFSTGIILFSSLFSSPESLFLLSTPVPDDHVFAYKFRGAIAFSSWGYLLLGSPVMIAYGLQIENGAPWYFFALLPLFFIGFVLIPGSAGAFACLFLVNFIPRHRFQLVLGVLVWVVGGLVLWGYLYLRETAQNFMLTKQWFETFLNELGELRSNFYPHHWVAGGLKSAAVGELEQSLYYLALVWSNGLFLYVIITWLARKLYRRGVNRIHTGGNLQKAQIRGQWLDSATQKFLFFLDPQTRLLIIKDFRTFRRDPAQWMQILIFVGLGGFYFFNMRRFFERDINLSFRFGISLLTLVATAFLMCAYTGRFIYPLLSLEGRKFWILGLLPLDRQRLVWGKFVFSAVTSFVPYQILVLIGDWMLQMPLPVCFLHVVTMGLLSLGLSGISVGMGALIPNFRENDPSKIAIGFGGTLNLVAGLLFLVIVICFTALPIHVVYARHESNLPVRFEWIVWVLAVIGTAIGLAGTWIPLKVGTHYLEKMEF